MEKLEKVIQRRTEDIKTNTPKGALELRQLRKAKYTRRWKGKDGKWHYEYGDKGKKVTGIGTSKQGDVVYTVKPTGREEPNAQQVKIMREYESKRNDLHEDLVTAAKKDNKKLVDATLKKLDTLAENISKSGIPYYTGKKALKEEKETARMILKYAKKI